MLETLTNDCTSKYLNLPYKFYVLQGRTTMSLTKLTEERILISTI